MRVARLVAGLVVLTSPALAEVRAEAHVVGDWQVQIVVAGYLETLTLRRSAQDKVEVLSGADVEIVLFAGDPDSVALIGQPVLLVEVTGTHSCDMGDARAYWAVTLGAPPAADGPVTTCQKLTPSATAGMAVLEADPMGGGEFWAWTPGKGWSGQAE